MNSNLNSPQCIVKGDRVLIIGIGTDMIEIDRVLKACTKKRFLEKYYTEKEIELYEIDHKKAASNFAVKEAVSKVFGTGFSHISPKEIEVLRDDKGKPFVRLYGKALQYAKNCNIKMIHISITNTKKYVSVFVIGEGE